MLRWCSGASGVVIEYSECCFDGFMWKISPSASVPRPETVSNSRVGRRPGRAEAMGVIGSLHSLRFHAREFVAHPESAW